MSALVEHGPWPQDRLSMHPFFQTVHHRPQQSQRETESTSLPKDYSDIRQDEDGDDSSSSASLIPSSSPSTSHVLPQAHHHDDGSIDLNLDRRKRRRITPSPDVPQACEAGFHTNDTAQISVESLSKSERKENDSDNKTDQPAQIQAMSGHPDLRRRSGRILSVQDPHQQSPSFSRELTINLSPSKAKQAAQQPLDDIKTTPKKKMLHLSSNGKLAKSPKRSPNKKRMDNATRGPAKNLSLKHGRIVSTLRIILPYPKASVDDTSSIGSKIEKILNGDFRLQVPQPPMPNSHVVKTESKPQKSTHPFFLGKVAPLPGMEGDLRAADAASTAQNSDAEVTAEVKKPKAWGDIKFNSSKLVTSKDIATVTAPWPPLELQNHACRLRESPVAQCSEAYHRESKQKHETVRIPQTEDVLHEFASQMPNKQISAITVPDRRILNLTELSNAIDLGSGYKHTSDRNLPIIHNMKQRLGGARSAFDRGLPAGPNDWAHIYAPRRTSDVLQPQSQLLLEWLQKMKVHHVQSKLATTDRERPAKAARRRGRPKKRTEDLDDFIVSSDDEICTNHVDVKNAILICGPHGCGKTASVFAAAAELDFEVFEIHPGMRRSAKDIFDRVGDMTHNHLVQQSTPMSRDGSMLTESTDLTTVDEEVSGSQQRSMASFVSGPKKRKKKQGATAEAPQEDRPSLQKQSVILLEEVDVLFEEDRSFWPGVQALIKQSKRPIVMTCNSLDGIPNDEIPLHATLSYTRPNADVATSYLSHLAAVEGHLLSHEALSMLYRSRGGDLRAVLMDLNFWCQMTVGSKVGGLDWMPSKSAMSSETARLPSRVVSCHTFRGGLNLAPEKPSALEDRLALYQDQLGISALEWEESREYAPVQDERVPAITSLDEALILSDGRSCMDVMDPAIGPMLSSQISSTLPNTASAVNEEAIVHLIAQRSSHTRLLSRQDVASSLTPLMEDLRTFPPPTGRTCPSIDSASYSLTTDVAPYVRMIVAFDQRLEQQRSELGGGSQSKKQRTTRAARAALEGGEKANTRRERWFPKELDFKAVLDSGNDWPQYQEEEVAISPDSETTPEPMEVL